MMNGFSSKPVSKSTNKQYSKCTNWEWFSTNPTDGAITVFQNHFDLVH